MPDLNFSLPLPALTFVQSAHLLLGQDAGQTVPGAAVGAGSLGLQPDLDRVQRVPGQNTGRACNRYHRQVGNPGLDQFNWVGNDTRVQMDT